MKTVKDNFFIESMNGSKNLFVGVGLSTVILSVIKGAINNTPLFLIFFSLAIIVTLAFALLPVIKLTLKLRTILRNNVEQDRVDEIVFDQFRIESRDNNV